MSDGDDGQILLECQNVTQYSIDGGQTYSTGGIFTDLIGGEYKIKLVNDQTGCTFDTLVNLAIIQCDEICADGQDNDGDGDIDCDDIDCNCTLSNQIWISNIFSPINEDGINDFLIIEFDRIRYLDEIEINIYDRWGNLIYFNKQADSRKLWDGSTYNTDKANYGVYIAKIYLFERGSNKKIMKTEIITVI
ncbi:MAG: gliding motility-associated C-terminal domain-containing protein [Saprospiraceae bacterium]